MRKTLCLRIFEMITYCFVFDLQREISRENNDVFYAVFVLQYMYHEYNFLIITKPRLVCYTYIGNILS